MASKAEREIQKRMSEKVCNEAYQSSTNKLFNQNMKKPRK